MSEGAVIHNCVMCVEIVINDCVMCEYTEIPNCMISRVAEIRNCLMPKICGDSERNSCVVSEGIVRDGSV